MPCSSRIISKMLPEIHTVEKCGSLKPIIFLKSFNSLFAVHEILAFHILCLLGVVTAPDKKG